MNLENAQIHIERLSINSLMREATALVHVYRPLEEGLRQLDGSFEVKVEGEFLGVTDPVLLAAVTDRLSRIQA